MKKVILIIAMLTFKNVTFSQNSNVMQKFLNETIDGFNKNVKKQVVNNLDSVIKSCQKRKISYSHRTYMVSIDSNNTCEINFAYLQTIINSKKIPFFMYNYSINFNTIMIQVVRGSDAL